jgi:hypothetical protein
MHRDAQFDELRVEIDAKVGVGQHQLVGRFGDELDVGQQSLRRTQPLEQPIGVTSVFQHHRPMGIPRHSRANAYCRVLPSARFQLSTRSSRSAHGVRWTTNSKSFRGVS